jgi:putative transposase
MPTQRRPYSSDLSNAEWQILEPLLPTAKPGGRHRGYVLCEIINAIQYLLRGGGAWRSLPHDLPHWQSSLEI